MNLVELKKYLKERRFTPMQDLVNRFRTDAGTIEPMLDIWIRKGRLKRHRCEGACQKGCGGCSSSDVEFLEWLE